MRILLIFTLISIVLTLFIATVIKPGGRYVLMSDQFKQKVYEIPTALSYCYNMHMQYYQYQAVTQINS